LEPRARLEHAKLQCEASAALHVGRMTVSQAQDSRLLTHTLALGAQLARTEIDLALAGARACAILNGLYLGNGRQHLDQQLRIVHAEPATRSEQYFYGVLDGRAQGIFKGMVEVDARAQQTDARQVNRNLLLSEHAEAVTLPQLQINANDVKCSHGATVGQLNEDALFYLRSRGIDAAHARALLTQAFAWEVLVKVEDTALRELIERSVLDYLPGTAGIVS
jgi:Fe-S cluster assembly protein SufD